MSASGTLDLDMRLTHVVPGGDGSENADQVHRMSKFLTVTKSYGGSSTPAISEVWSDTVDLVAGAASIDLAALARQAPLATLDLTGLNVVGWGFAGAAANTAGIEVAPGASNPYHIFGTADDQVTVYPGQVLYGYSTVADDLPAVAAGAKEIDFAGTGTESIHVLVFAG